MGNKNSSDYNKTGDIAREIDLNKVCYYPGDDIKGNLILSPKYNLIENIINNPVINIIITQYQNYSFDEGSDTKIEKDIIPLVNISINIKEALNNEMNDSKKIKIPIEFKLPIETYPSVYFGENKYVKHFLTVEYPFFNVKRTVMIIVKNNLSFQPDELKMPYEYHEQIKKSKLFIKKGSCYLKIKMPKNYFTYNEKIEFNINLDCKDLKIDIKMFRVSLNRTTSLNYAKQRFKTRSSYSYQICFKEYKINKKSNSYNIKDYFIFSDVNSHSLNSDCPSDVYDILENHGLFECDETKFNFLYPSCIGGLLSVKYFLKIIIFFKSSLTLDKYINIPIDFCSILDNNHEIMQNIKEKFPKLRGNAFNFWL